MWPRRAFCYPWRRRFNKNLLHNGPLTACARAALWPAAPHTPTVGLYNAAGLGSGLVARGASMRPCDGWSAHVAIGTFKRSAAPNVEVL